MQEEHGSLGSLKEVQDGQSVERKKQDGRGETWLDQGGFSSYDKEFEFYLRVS